MRMMTQQCAYPELLEEIVKSIEYKPDWLFFLRHTDRGQGSVGLTLEIVIDCVDTYSPDDNIRVRHSFIVPAASYDARSWRRWLFEQVLLVERHEAAEFFQVNGERPYAPHHGPGNDPYIIFELGTLQEKRTSYLGVKRSGDHPDTETEDDRRAAMDGDVDHA